MNEMVRVYSKSRCPKCVSTKRWLDENEVEYLEFNVEEDADAFDYVVNTLGIRQMPVVKKGDIVITGFNPDKLEELK